jgi:2-polyprenyl-3-methyl-5-hydroxy-6-metoxy-1,4-benzoquinol methylase
MLQPLARIGANVTGLDAGQGVIDVASSHVREDPSISDSITYICGTVEEHAKNHKEFYDVVVASEVLEHVDDTDLFLDACVTSLKV